MNGHDVIRDIVFAGLNGVVMTTVASKMYKESTNWIAGVSWAIIVFVVLTFLDVVIP